MVHNGIEYGDMQLIAETVTLLREGLGFSAARTAELLETWNGGDLDSYLIEVTVDVLRAEDAPGRPLVDAILDQAGQKGTGQWTVMAAAELGVPIPTIASAVEARRLSAARPRRQRAAALFPEPVGPLESLDADDLRQALYAAKVASYAQGFDLLRTADAARGYGTDLGEVARIWTGGCIIRARLLEGIMGAFRREPGLDLLCFAPEFRDELQARLPAWRRVVAAAAASGLPAPGLSASLAWFDTLRRARGSAYLIQAQRDYFGAHTYERTDRPGTAVHTEWPRTQPAKG
jgi:6-phosphogluconate dehydrogenase